jgi:hypothetical protein
MAEMGITRGMGMAIIMGMGTTISTGITITLGTAITMDATIIAMNMSYTRMAIIVAVTNLTGHGK